MQQAYLKYCKERGQKGNPVKGASTHYWKYIGKALKGETGTVFLSVEDCGAGIISHEFMHAVLWAYKHTKNKKQYPIVIKNMKEEEVILHNHTFVVQQFYKWYWRKVKTDPNE